MRARVPRGLERRRKAKRRGWALKWAWGLSDQEKTKHNPQEGRDTEGGWGERGGDGELGGTERRNSEVCPFKCGCKMPHCSTLERIPLGRRSHAAPGWGPLETAPRTQAPPRRKGNAQLSGRGINWKSSTPSRPHSHSDRLHAASFSRTKLFQSQKRVFYTLGM